MCQTFHHLAASLCPRCLSILDLSYRICKILKCTYSVALKSVNNCVANKEGPMEKDDPVKSRNYLNALNPPKSAPLAIPTQNPIVKPVFILEKHVGCWFAPYMLPGTAGILIQLQFFTICLNTWVAFASLSVKIESDEISLHTSRIQLVVWHFTHLSHEIRLTFVAKFMVFAVHFTELNRWRCLAPV